LYDSFRAEVLKLRKRHVMWILGDLWLAIVLLFLYLLPTLFVSVSIVDTPPEAGGSLEEQLPTLTLENLVAHLHRYLFPGLGVMVAIILGALTAGSEYGWGTLKIVLSQRASRLDVLFGKLLALGALLLLFVLIAFVGGAACSLTIALFSGVSLAPPAATELLRGVGAGTLILVVWAAFGFALATLFKGTVLPVGLGLIYVFAIEPALTTLFALYRPLWALIEFFPQVNAYAVSLAFRIAEDPALRGNFPGPTQSTLVSLLYTAAFVLVAALVFRERDVT
jgi:ABC-2 type transport system permease protein